MFDVRTRDYGLAPVAFFCTSRLPLLSFLTATASRTAKPIYSGYLVTVKFLVCTILMWYVFVVNTLAEIEAAVESLPPNEKEELLRFIAARLRDQTAAPCQQVELSRSRRGFPISKGRVPFTSADVARIESETDAFG